MFRMLLAALALAFGSITAQAGGVTALSTSWTKIGSAGSYVEVSLISGSVQIVMSTGVPTSTTGTALSSGALVDYKPLSRDLYASAVTGSASVEVGNLLPYSSVELTGLINSTIPSALLTKVPWQYTDPYNYPYGVGYGILPSSGYSSPAGSDLWSMIAYRPASTSINESFMTTVSALPKTAEQGTATLTVSYDTTNNQTTYQIQNSSSSTTMIVPLDLQAVNDLVSRGIGAGSVGQSFSGSVNGVSYQGKVANTSFGRLGNSPSYPITSTSSICYQFFDADGTLLVAVDTNTTSRLFVYWPNSIIAVLQGTLTASAKTGSGTFSQTGGGQTLSGTFLPTSIMALQNTATVNDADLYFYNN